jgi:ribose transport system ATP-binding protein
MTNILPRLEMKEIGKRFGAVSALEDVSVAVYPGEILALIGENGAGKSTLMKVLSGALQADAGNMTLDNWAYQPRGPLDARKAGVAMIYQELSLARHLSVKDNIMLGAEPSCCGVINWKKIEENARAALAQLEHSDINLESKVGSLSVGMQQLVEIARAIAVGCKVLILDEPTSSLSGQDAK